MGLSVSPAIWQSSINNIPGSIPDISMALVILNNLLLHSSNMAIRNEIH